MADDQLTVQSATGVDLTLSIAGPGHRSYAFVIDWHIRLLLAGAWLHVPFAQHPPLHIWVGEHAVVHVLPLQAYPAGQLVVTVQLVVHWPFLHVIPPAHAWADPHPPQLFGSLVKSAHAPLHRLKPASQVNVHAPFTHAACAFATLVEHDSPHVPQLAVSVLVSTQAPPQRALALAGHPDAQAYAPPSSPAAHNGVPPSAEHVMPQPPQLDAVVS